MSLFSGVKKMVGKITSKVGEILNSEFLANIGAKLEERTNDAASLIGTLKSYNPKQLTSSEVNKINSALSKYVLSQRTDLRKIETAFINVIDDFSIIVKEVLEDKVICAQFDNRCDEERQYIHDNLTETISNYINTSNDECMLILRMRPSAKKEKAIQLFFNKVQYIAIKDIKAKLKNSLKNMHLLLEKEFESSYQEKKAYNLYLMNIINDYKKGLNQEKDVIKRINEVEQYSNKILNSLIDKDENRKEHEEKGSTLQ